MIVSEARDQFQEMIDGFLAVSPRLGIKFITEDVLKWYEELSGRSSSMSLEVIPLIQSDIFSDDSGELYGILHESYLDRAAIHYELPGFSQNPKLWTEEQTEEIEEMLGDEYCYVESEFFEDMKVVCLFWRLSFLEERTLGVEHKYRSYTVLVNNPIIEVW